MAAEMAGGALLSSFLNVLFDRLATREVVDLFRGKKVIADLLAELKIRLLSANSLLNDAEEKQFRDQNVKNWLEEVKEVLYRADHVMDKINTEALRCEMEEGESVSKASRIFSLVQKFYSPFDNTVKSEMQEILDRLKLLLDQNSSLGLKEGVHWKPLQITSPAPVVEESWVFGRDAEKESLIESILSDDGSGYKISVIPIVGLGGIGKSTLAQLVYDDSKVQEHFELKVWVTVAEEFDIVKMTKVILRTLNVRECSIEDLHQLQSELKNALMGKKFLIVLDDVWNEDYRLWDLLKSPFEFGANGSKIIVTTRSEIVALRMGTDRTWNLQKISDDDSWKLFAKNVLLNKLDAGVQSDLQKIGTEIVKKCKGLPLAVKSIAGLLRSVSDPEEWRRILQSDVWELQFEENQKQGIPPALWLSYRFLPQQLKRCFAYCSIFPKDYEFRGYNQENLIWLWMAEGLLQPEKGKTMEDVGEEYLKALASRSFFQQANRYGESILMMHDLVHDLAVRVSGEFYFIQDGSNYWHDYKSKIYHLSYLKMCNNMKLESLPEGECLRTFLALPLSIWSFGESKMTEKIQQELLLRAGGCLRVLSLSQSSITKLPDSIGNLKHLRYLDLSWTEFKELPSSVCTLYNLQTLLLSGCQQLTQLPIDMCRLISLRHLEITGTPLKEMPPQMCNLTNLQTLSDFVLGENNGSRIKELGALKLLRGSLCISGLENVVDIGDVLEANLNEKEQLTKLILRWKGGEVDDSSKEREVLNALEPHTKLKKLRIEGYRGTIFPDWVANTSFDDLVEVCLENCLYCYLFPPFWQLPSLRELSVSKMHVSEVIHSDASLNTPFKFLETLSLSEMFELERWPTGANQEGWLFPCLKLLHLFHCNKLNVGLPAGCLPSLESILIWNCKEMVSVFPASQEIDIAYPSLEIIMIWECEKVESFSEMGLPSNLKELHIISCDKLISNRRKWNLQRLSNLQSLWLQRCEEIVENSFPEEGLLPSSLTSLSIWDFTNLKSLNGKGFQHLASLQRLYISNCEKVEWLPEEGLPLSLSTFEIVGCPLLSERCKRETGEDWPKIQHIPRIEIDSKQI